MTERRAAYRVTPKAKTGSDLEAELLYQIRAERLPEPILQHRFHPVRKWLLDFAWPSILIGAEVQGGTWSGGAHVQGAGYQRDCDKLNEALLLGWQIFHFTSQDVKSGRALDYLTRAIRRAEYVP